MAERFRSDYLRRQRELDRLPLERAIERGDLAADVDIDLILDQLIGPIYYRVLVTGKTVGNKFTNSLVAEFLKTI